jgi:hypothetical protein
LSMKSPVKVSVTRFVSLHGKTCVVLIL